MGENRKQGLQHKKSSKLEEESVQVFVFVEMIHSDSHEYLQNKSDICRCRIYALVLEESAQLAFKITIVLVYLV